MIKVIVADNVAAEIVDLDATLGRIVSISLDEQRRSLQPMLLSDYRVQGIHGPVWLSVKYLHEDETMRIIFKDQALEMNAHPECWGGQSAETKGYPNEQRRNRRWHRGHT
jgi:hypothetical protein